MGCEVLINVLLRMCIGRCFVDYFLWCENDWVDYLCFWV